MMYYRAMVELEPHVRVFPVDSPILPASRQIGRADFIDYVYRGAVEQLTTLVLLDERRVGKTSAALAVTARARDNGVVAVDIDLSTGITSGTALAAALAVGVSAANLPGAKKIVTPRKIAGVTIPFTKAVQSVVEEDNAVDVAAALADAISAAAVPDATSLRTLLERIADKARETRKTVLIFVDELQDLVDWPDGLDVQKTLASIMHQPDNPIVFLFAGSKPTILETIFAKGQPLHHDCVMCPVPMIVASAWRAGLRARFAEVGVIISDERVDEILTCTDGHPQDTMRVCLEVHAAVQINGDTVVNELHLSVGIARAKEHPSWGR